MTYVLHYHLYDTYLQVHFVSHAYMHTCTTFSLIPPFPPQKISLQAGKTALIYATMGKHLQIVKHLCVSGADTGISDEVRKSIMCTL